MVSVICAIVVAFSYDTIEVSNGSGLGIPLESADENTRATIDFTQDGDTILISGDYVGSVNSKDIVLVLSEKKAIYVQDGQLRYYNGDTDSAITSMRASINYGWFNGSPFEWVYYPAVGGPYRSYDSAVQFDIDQRVAGFGSHDGDAIISMNNTVTSNNVDGQPIVIIKRTSDGIEEIRYRWEVSES